MAGIINLSVDDLFLEQVETKWNNVFWPDLENIFKLVQRIGTMQPLQDKEFARHKTPQTGRAWKSVKTRPLMSWRRSQWNEIRRKTSIALLQMHRMYRSLLGQINWLQSRTQFHSNVATNFQMRFEGSFSNSRRCEVSQQTGEKNQIKPTETSVLATHRTIENTWIS